MISLAPGAEGNGGDLDESFSPAGQALETLRPDVASIASSLSGGLNSKLQPPWRTTCGSYLSAICRARQSLFHPGRRLEWFYIPMTYRKPADDLGMR